MSATVTLTCESRTDTGKSAARRLRREGQIPAILYGGDRSATPLSVGTRDLIDFLRHHPRNTVAALEVDGTTRSAVIKELSVHPVTRRMLHLDFLEIVADRPITLEVPLVATGQDPAGVRHGGILQVVRDRVRVRCLPGDLPEAIEVNLTDLDIDQTFTVADLDTSVSVLAPQETVLFKIVAPRIEKAIVAEGEEGEGEEGEAAGEEATEE